MLAPARHFQPRELACKDGTPYPDAWGGRWDRLVIKTADPIRDWWGGALFVVSGLRSEAYNEELRKKRTGSGVAQSSTHIDGEALDLRPIGKFDTPDPVLQLHNLVLRLYREKRLPELGGLGLYPGWIHIDVRKAPDGHLRRWNDR